jgi:hypothetical protein
MSFVTPAEWKYSADANKCAVDLLLAAIERDGATPLEGLTREKRLEALHCQTTFPTISQLYKVHGLLRRSRDAIRGRAGKSGWAAGTGRARSTPTAFRFSRSHRVPLRRAGLVAEIRSGLGPSVVVKPKPAGPRVIIRRRRRLLRPPLQQCRTL